jgi:hypothetical protein
VQSFFNKKYSLYSLTPYISLMDNSMVILNHHRKYFKVYVDSSAK